MGELLYNGWLTVSPQHPYREDPSKLRPHRVPVHSVHHAIRTCIPCRLARELLLCISGSYG